MLTPGNREAFNKYLNAVVEYIRQDAADKRQPVPGPFRIVETDTGGQILGSSAFKYVVTGRGPGKFPPPDRMLAFVDKHPDMVTKAKTVYANITNKSLAYLIGRKIAQRGTDIFTGRRPGIDFLGAADAPMDALLKTIARNEAIQIVTGLKNELNRNI